MNRDIILIRIVPLVKMFLLWSILVSIGLLAKITGNIIAGNDMLQGHELKNLTIVLPFTWIVCFCVAWFYKPLHLPYVKKQAHILRHQMNFYRSVLDNYSHKKMSIDSPLQIMNFLRTIESKEYSEAVKYFKRKYHNLQFEEHPQENDVESFFIIQISPPDDKKVEEIISLLQNDGITESLVDMIHEYHEKMFQIAKNDMESKLMFTIDRVFHIIDTYTDHLN